MQLNQLKLHLPFELSTNSPGGRVWILNRVAAECCLMDALDGFPEFGTFYRIRPSLQIQITLYGIRMYIHTNRRGIPKQCHASLHQVSLSCWIDWLIRWLRLLMASLEASFVWLGTVQPTAKPWAPRRLGKEQRLCWDPFCCELTLFLGCKPRGSVSFPFSVKKPVIIHL